MEQRLYQRTRKLSYRKDDPAMRHIGLYECPEKFREFLTTPMGTFPEIFDGFLPRDASAERGNATVSRPSVRLSVCP